MVDMQRWKRSKIPLVRVILIVIVAGFGLFYTSQLWYPESGESVEPTDYYSIITANDRDIQLCSWAYSPAERKMEIEIAILNKSLDGQNTYEFSAMDRKKGMLTVEKVLEAADLIVLQIPDVPKSWSSISLRMELPASQNAEARTIRLYANKDSVSTVEHITVRTEAEYRIDRLEATIAAYEKSIEELEEQILSLDEEIANYKYSIVELTSRLEYQTEQEQTETNQLISQAQSNITNAQSQQEDCREEITEYQARIENARIQLEELAGKEAEE